MKYVLILSKGDDISTRLVIEWLKYLGVNWHLIEDEDEIRGIKISLAENIMEINHVDLTKFTSYWIRKGQLPKINIRSTIEESEFKKLKNFILKHIEQSHSAIGSITSELDHNKIQDLYLAQMYNLDIPKTWIINCKEDLEEIGLSHSLIVKPLADYYVIDVNKDSFCLDISEYKQKTQLENYFFPSLIQEKLTKLFDIRTFFLNNDYWSVAVFSQRHIQSTLSFKKFDTDSTPRIIPFKLPKMIIKKLNKCVKAIGLNTGSIDIVYGKDHRYYFIEVNPTGQYHWVSEAGNFNLDKKIAEQLCKK